MIDTARNIKAQEHDPNKEKQLTACCLLHILPIIFSAERIPRSSMMEVTMKNENSGTIFKASMCYCIFCKPKATKYKFCYTKGRWVVPLEYFCHDKTKYELC
jgi:hypothetical protein